MDSKINTFCFCTNAKCCKIMIIIQAEPAILINCISFTSSSRILLSATVQIAQQWRVTQVRFNYLEIQMCAERKSQNVTIILSRQGGGTLVSMRLWDMWWTMYNIGYQLDLHTLSFNHLSIFFCFFRKPGHWGEKSRNDVTAKTLCRCFQGAPDVFPGQKGF